MLLTILDFPATIADYIRDSGCEKVFTEIDAWLLQVHDLDAHHFCISRQTDTINPVNLACFLSYQLTCIEGFVQDILEGQGTPDLLRQFYADGSARPLLVLADTLDEAVQQRKPETTVDLLANARGLPP